MKHWGWLLILAGAALAVLGGVLLLIGKVPWLGRLPGDIRVEGRHVSFFFPLATCVILSVVLTILVNLLLRLFHR